MGDRMLVYLTVGPLTENQKTRLPEVMARFMEDLGIDYDPEPFTGDPARIRFTLEEINHGLARLGTEFGRLEFLIDEKIPYRVTDDGGNYLNGSDAIWHPDFGEKLVLRRQANKEMNVVISEQFVENLAGLDNETIGRALRGLTKTDPSDPELEKAFRLVRVYVARQRETVSEEKAGS